MLEPFRKNHPSGTAGQREARKVFFIFEFGDQGEQGKQGKVISKGSSVGSCFLSPQNILLNEILVLKEK